MRTFHQRFSLGNKIAILLATSLAFYLMWNRWVLGGLVVVLAIVAMTERVLHTTYTFIEQDGSHLLLVKHGRFSKTKTIRVDEVVKIMHMATSFGMSHYLLMQYGNGHLQSLQPADEDSFCKELKRRMKEGDRENER